MTQHLYQDLYVSGMKFIFWLDVVCGVAIFWNSHYHLKHVLSMYIILATIVPTSNERNGAESGNNIKKGSFIQLNSSNNTP